MALLLDVVRGSHWRTKLAQGRTVTLPGGAEMDEDTRAAVDVALRAAVEEGESCARVRYHRTVLALACRNPDDSVTVLFRERSA